MLATRGISHNAEDSTTTSMQKNKTTPTTQRLNLVINNIIVTFVELNNH
jgi:hypothetical protein